MKLIQKMLLVAVTTMISAPAYAMSDLTPFFHTIMLWLGLAIGTCMSPFVVGWLITKKGRKSWFSNLSRWLYAASALAMIIGLSLSHKSPFVDTILGVLIISPLLLLPVAIYTHWQKAPSIEVEKDEKSVEF